MAVAKLAEVVVAEEAEEEMVEVVVAAAVTRPKTRTAMTKSPHRRALRAVRLPVPALEVQLLQATVEQHAQLSQRRWTAAYRARLSAISRLVCIPPDAAWRLQHLHQSQHRLIQTRVP